MGAARRGILLAVPRQTHPTRGATVSAVQLGALVLALYVGAHAGLAVLRWRRELRRSARSVAELLAAQAGARKSSDRGS